MKQYSFRVNGVIHHIRATKLHTALGRLGETLVHQGYDKPERLHNNLTISAADCVTIKPKCENPSHDKNLLQVKGNVNEGGTVKNEMLMLPHRRWLKLCRVCNKIEQEKYELHKAGQQHIDQVQK
jgi:hypothetical protein